MQSLALDGIWIVERIDVARTEESLRDAKNEIDRARERNRSATVANEELQRKVSEANAEVERAERELGQVRLFFLSSRVCVFVLCIIGFRPVTTGTRDGLHT